MNDTALWIIAAIILTFGLIWVPTIILIWRLASRLTEVFGIQLRSRDRERHDAIAIAERIAEKALADAKFAVNIHAEERDRLNRRDMELSREEIRAVVEPETEDTAPPPREFANTLEEAMG